VSVAEAFSQTFPAPDWWQAMDTSQRVFAVALVFSTLAHAGLLGLKFAEPDEIRQRSRDNPLEVILVNAKHASKPVKAEALAQANLDGGGDAAQGRAQSFLVNSRRVQEGDELQQTTQRLREIEAEQRKLLSALNGQSKVAVVEVRPRVQPEPLPPTPELTGTDMVINSSTALTAEAEIKRRIAFENSRPKRGYVTPSTQEVAYALYYKNWADKIERIGNEHYPDKARGGTYQLTMTVSVLADGQVEKIDIERSSGLKEVDAAARRIVKLGAPYGQFSSQMRAEYGVLDLTMKWTFSRTDALSVESQK
jgi:protein TonB